MNLSTEQARQFANSLLAAADRAELEGRDKLLESDIVFFQMADDEARLALQAAIDKAGK